MQKKLTIKIFKFSLWAFFIIAPILAVNAEFNFAKIFLVLDKSTFLNPEIISFDLKLDSATTTINALDARLSFNPENLELISTNSTSSLCNFFIDETIDNQTGRYQLLCGTEKNNMMVENQIINLTFKKIKAGITQINLSSDSQVLQNDGLGTNLNTISETYNIFILK